MTGFVALQTVSDRFSYSNKLTDSGAVTEVTSPLDKQGVQHQRVDSTLTPADAEIQSGAAETSQTNEKSGGETQETDNTIEKPADTDGQTTGESKDLAEDKDQKPDVVSEGTKLEAGKEGEQLDEGVPAQDSNNSSNEPEQSATSQAEPVTEDAPAKDEPGNTDAPADQSQTQEKPEGQTQADEEPKLQQPAEGQSGAEAETSQSPPKEDESTQNVQEETPAELDQGSTENRPPVQEDTQQQEQDTNVPDSQHEGATDAATDAATGATDNENTAPQEGGSDAKESSQAVVDSKTDDVASQEQLQEGQDKGQTQEASGVESQGDISGQAQEGADDSKSKVDVPKDTEAQEEQSEAPKSSVEETSNSAAATNETEQNTADVTDEKQGEAGDSAPETAAKDGDQGPAADEAKDAGLQNTQPELLEASQDGHPSIEDAQSKAEENVPLDGDQAGQSNSGEQSKPSEEADTNIPQDVGSQGDNQDQSSAGAVAGTQLGGNEDERPTENLGGDANDRDEQQSSTTATKTEDAGVHDNEQSKEETTDLGQAGSENTEQQADHTIPQDSQTAETQVESTQEPTEEPKDEFLESGDKAGALSSKSNAEQPQTSDDHQQPSSSEPQDVPSESRDQQESKEDTNVGSSEPINTNDPVTESAVEDGGTKPSPLGDSQQDKATEDTGGVPIQETGEGSTGQEAETTGKCPAHTNSEHF